LALCTFGPKISSFLINNYFDTNFTDYTV